jgi:hypothetical protein
MSANYSEGPGLSVEQRKERLREAINEYDRSALITGLHPVWLTPA